MFYVLKHSVNGSMHVHMLSILYKATVGTMFIDTVLSTNLIKPFDSLTLLRSADFLFPNGLPLDRFFLLPGQKEGRCASNSSLI